MDSHRPIVDVSADAVAAHCDGIVHSLPYALGGVAAFGAPNLHGVRQRGVQIQNDLSRRGAAGGRLDGVLPLALVSRSVCEDVRRHANNAKGRASAAGVGMSDDVA